MGPFEIGMVDLKDDETAENKEEDNPACAEIKHPAEGLYAPVFGKEEYRHAGVK